LDPGAAAGFVTERFAGPDLGEGEGGAAKLWRMDLDWEFHFLSIVQYTIVANTRDLMHYI